MAMPLSSYAIISMILFAVVGFWGASNLNSELRKSYPSQWQDLGSPIPFSVNSARQELRWIGFIVLRKYCRLGDRRISKFGNVVFFCGLANLAILISWAFIPHGLAPMSG